MFNDIINEIITEWNEYIEDIKHRVINAKLQKKLKWHVRQTQINNALCNSHKKGVGISNGVEGVRTHVDRDSTQQHKISTHVDRDSIQEHKNSIQEHKISTQEHKISTQEHKNSTQEHKISTQEHKISTQEHKNRPLEQDIQNDNTKRMKIVVQTTRVVQGGTTQHLVDREIENTKLKNLFKKERKKIEIKRNTVFYDRRHSDDTGMPEYEINTKLNRDRNSKKQDMSMKDKQNDVRDNCVDVVEEIQIEKHSTDRHGDTNIDCNDTCKENNKDVQSDRVNVQSDKVNVQRDKVNVQRDKVNVQRDKVNVQRDKVNVQSVNTIVENNTNEKNNTLNIPVCTTTCLETDTLNMKNTVCNISIHSTPHTTTVYKSSSTQYDTQDIVNTQLNKKKEELEKEREELERIRKEIEKQKEEIKQKKEELEMKERELQKERMKCEEKEKCEERKEIVGMSKVEERKNELMDPIIEGHNHIEHNKEDDVKERNTVGKGESVEEGSTLEKSTSKNEVRQLSDRICISDNKNETQQLSDRICISDNKNETQQLSDRICISDSENEIQQLSDRICISDSENEIQQLSDRICISDNKNETQQLSDRICISDNKNETQQLSDRICISDNKNETHLVNVTHQVNEHKNETQQVKDTMSYKDWKRKYLGLVNIKDKINIKKDTSTSDRMNATGIRDSKQPVHVSVHKHTKDKEHTSMSQYTKKDTNTKLNEPLQSIPLHTPHDKWNSTRTDINGTDIKSTDIKSTDIKSTNTNGTDIKSTDIKSSKNKEERMNVERNDIYDVKTSKYVTRIPDRKPDLYKTVIDNQRMHDFQNEYKSSTIIPRIQSDEEDSMMFIEPTFSKEECLNKTVCAQKHDELEQYFSVDEGVDVQKLFPNIKDVSNDSPNKWV